MKSLSEIFERKYLDSLDYYRFFYDDLCEYGSPSKSKMAIYFIPGFNGVAGQIRFGLPSIIKELGSSIYIKCLHLEEFSASRPKWDKYSLANIKKRQNIIVEDLRALIPQFESTLVVTSSTGFYDFAAVHHLISSRLLDNVKLVWVACAPDNFSKSKWEKLFSPISGLNKHGFSWIAIPNANPLGTINPECKKTYYWSNNKQRQIFYKHNLESRFDCFGLTWDYMSTECAKWVIDQNLSNIQHQIEIPSYVLAATNDGYWQNKPLHDIRRCINKYLAKSTVHFKNNSHLWVNEPQNLAEIISAAVSSDVRDPVTRAKQNVNASSEISV